MKADAATPIRKTNEQSGRALALVREPLPCGRGCDQSPVRPQAAGPRRWPFGRTLLLLTALCLGPPATIIAQTKDGGTTKPAVQAASSMPVAQVDATTHDFGTTWIGHKLEHAFTLTNAGTAPLDLIKVSAPFGCALVGEAPKRVAPGESAKLTFVIDTDSLRKDHYEKRIGITTNDPHNPAFELILRGQCRRFIRVMPMSAGFGRIQSTDLRERVLTVHIDHDKPVELSLAPPEGRFKFDLIETIKGREYKLFVNTQPPFEPGTHRVEAVLKTNIAAQPEVRVGVYAVVPNRIEAVPTYVPLQRRGKRETHRNTPQTHVIQFNNHGSSPVNALDVSCTDPAVKVKLREVVAGRRYRLLVKLPANYETPVDGASIAIKTDDKEQPTFLVPIGRSRLSPTARASGGKAPGTKKRAKKERPALKLIGKPAPQFALQTLDGIRVSNAELEFHPATVLNFFAPNCKYSKRQIPKVEASRAEFESQGIRFVNVSQKMKIDFTSDEVQQTVSAIGAIGELAIDEKGNKTGRRFKVTGFPTLFVIRENGIIDHVIAGNKKTTQAILHEKLSAILAGEASPPTPTATTQPAAAGS